MKRLVHAICNKVCPGAIELLSNLRILSTGHGQWRAIRTRSAVDASGAALPWYTYPAIEYLRGFDFSECDVFEFGSGNSSIYWAGRARTVVSVEHDAEWFGQVSARRRGNQVVLHRPDSDSYARAIADQGKVFDVIIVDGQWRMECVQQALPFLKAEGLLLLDNSDRVAELECAAWLRGQGLFEVDFSGFGPINGYSWSTSLFFRNGQAMQKRGFKGPTPVGGLGN